MRSMYGGKKEFIVRRWVKRCMATKGFAFKGLSKIVYSSYCT